MFNNFQKFFHHAGKQISFLTKTELMDESASCHVGAYETNGSLVAELLDEFELLIGGMFDGVFDNESLVLTLKLDAYVYLDLFISRSRNLLSNSEQNCVASRILDDNLLFGYGRRPFIDQTSLKAGSTPSEAVKRSPGETG
ncbi:hypothetical protein PRIPAC_77155 [Pristionchus pacificus]|uniref:Uncharacterized protein n=1 Tax=Pristionchus pacificus TaxID=54126 RepID=A0A2A6BHP8_PRIPA|nr:hypothetical protein PRIPAC_77155 [Pristionchus pacificus]|eukprot:PDM65424.1 hypothetical protein PRIPAC_52366 [Pristionchus pacificus]